MNVDPVNKVHRAAFDHLRTTRLDLADRITERLHAQPGVAPETVRASVRKMVDELQADLSICAQHLWGGYLTDLYKGIPTSPGCISQTRLGSSTTTSFLR